MIFRASAEIINLHINMIQFLICWTIYFVDFVYILCPKNFLITFITYSLKNCMDADIGWTFRGADTIKFVFISNQGVGYKCLSLNFVVSLSVVSLNFVIMNRLYHTLRNFTIFIVNFDLFCLSKSKIFWEKFVGVITWDFLIFQTLNLYYI